MMGGAARILSSRLLPYRISLFCLTRSCLPRQPARPSLAAAGSSVCHYSLSPPPVQPLFFFGSASDHRRQLHSQANIAADYPLCRSRPWPEWSSFLESLAAAGYSNPTTDFPAAEDFIHDFPEELLGPASVCLDFARNHPTLLGMLTRSDIEMVVQKGSPFCFKNGDESQSRMRLYISSGSSDASHTAKATTVDLMKYILSYISSPAAPKANDGHNIELIESSLRNLLSELVKLSYGAPNSSVSGSVQSLFIDRHDRPLRSLRKIEMKRGDWICPRCNFMNFARNVKCLECEEARPKRLLTDGEWECPQCDFFNYGRNTLCLRCECKRPGGVSLGPINVGSGSGQSDANHSINTDVERKLAANEEKAQRWFSKVTELSSTSDVNNAIADEDFPEIMPLRKGVNKFVVSTRKTPLERRLANNAQYQGNRGHGHNFVNKTLSAKISKSLDEILGHSSVPSESDSDRASAAQPPGNKLGNNQPNMLKPVVPYPSDRVTGHHQAGVDSSSQNFEISDPMRYEKLGDSNGQQMDSQSWTQESSWQNMHENGTVANGTQTVGNPLSFRDRAQHSWNSGHSLGNTKENDIGDNGSRMVQNPYENSFNPPTGNNWSWGNGYPNQQNASIAADGTHISGDFSAKSYKFETSNNSTLSNGYLDGEGTRFPTNGTCTVGNPVTDPFSARTGCDRGWHHGYASKNNESFTANGTWMAGNSSQASNNGSWGDGCSNKADASFAYDRTHGNSSQNSFNPQASDHGNWSSGYSSKANARFAATGTHNVGYLSQNSSDSQTNRATRWNTGYSQNETATKDTSVVGISPQTSVAQNPDGSWNGKSLEGSGIREPDALDMSEEAKAERWFKRVAQIKDISELSQIPDEDFPSIMPMRKGVNRFVVSKRKTPLERRLTSQQYRRNLPTVTSDEFLKKNNEE